MSVLAAASALLLFLVPGYALTTCLPSLRRRQLPVRLALAWLLGVAWVGGLLYAGSHVLGVPIDRTSALAIAGIPALGAAVTFAVRRRAGLRRGRRPFRRLLAVPLAAGAFTTGAVMLDAATDPVTDWDGRMTWGAHARHIQAARSVDAEVLREERFLVFLPRYPKLLPVAQAAALEVSGSPDERVLRVLYAAFLPALLVLLFAFTAPRAGLEVGCGLTAVAALVPQLTFHAWGSGGLESDVPLGCFLGTALLLRLERGRGPLHGLAAGMLLAAAVLTKEEGLPLAAAVLVLGALAAWRGARGAPAGSGGAEPPVSLAVAALVTGLSAALVLSWRGGIADRLAVPYLPISPASIPEAAARLLRACAAAGESLLDPEHWGLFWPVALVCLLLGRRAVAGPFARPLLLFVAVAGALYAGAWAFSTHPVETLVERTLSRFLAQLSLPIFALLALALRDRYRPKPATM